MFLSDQIRAVIFVTAVLTVYALSFLALAGRIRAWRLGRPRPRSPGRRLLETSLLGLAVLGLVCMAYGYFVEPYWPEVTHIRLNSELLAPGARPIRLVVVSDLHSDPLPRLEERIPQIIAAEHPDLVLFLGDAINSPEALPVFQKCLTGLSRLAPVYAVRGNWDVAYWQNMDLFGGTGAEELRGDLIELKIEGMRLRLVGAAMGFEGAFRSVLNRPRKGAFTILMYHTPDLIEDLPPDGVDLYVAGHTHGGQVALPLYGALVTLSKFGKKYEAGLYHVRHTTLYVNRGIGMEGGPVPRVRFCARPEITVFEIGPQPQLSRRLP